MIRRIIETSGRFRLLVVAVAAAVMATGMLQLRDARLDVLPEFSPTVVQVRTEALGLSAGEVERMLTTPIEKDMFSGIAWLDELRSESITSLSSIDLVFEPGTDLMEARQLVQERLALSPGLPSVSKVPEMLQPLSSSNRVLIVELSSGSLSPIELSVLARWRVQPHLMGVPGVANVSIWGNRDRQLQVQVDPERLESKNVPLQKVTESTANALWFSPLSFVEASVPGTGGFIDGPNQRLPVQHVLPIKTAEELAEVTVEGTGGKVRLGDVADVVEDHQPLIGDTLIEGEPGLALVVEKLPGASTPQVTERVEETLARMKRGLPGVEVDSTQFRPASFIDAALENLLVLALLAGLLLVVVIFLLLLAWRSTLVALVSIVLSLLTAGLVLHGVGATFNVVLLAGLVMGLVVIVEEAVSDVHAVVRDRSAADGHRPSLADAALAVRIPMLFATLIIAATGVPLLLFGGTTGAFYRELATAYLIAVAAGMVVALTVTPALSSFLLSGAGRAEPATARLLRRGYQAVLARVVRRPVAAYSAVGAIIVAGLVVLPLMSPPSLLPPLKDRDVLVTWSAAPGTSHDEMVRIGGKAADALRAVPGVRRVGTHMGRAVTSDRIREIDSGTLWVDIDPGADRDATVEGVRDVVSGYPGIDGVVRTYPEELLAQDEGPVAGEVVVRVYGDDPGVLAEKAQEIRRAASGIDGVASARAETGDRVPTIQIEVDLKSAQHHGVKPGDVRRAAATYVQGLEVGNLFEDQKVFDVTVWGGPALRGDLSRIRDIRVDRPEDFDGEGRVPRVRLSDVAKVEVAPQSSVIRHEATSRYIDVIVSAGDRGRDQVVQDVRGVLAGIEFPADHHAEIRDVAGHSAGAGQVLLAGLVAALGVFLLLQSAVTSWRLTGALFLVLPAAVAGGLLGPALTGGEPTIGSVGGLLVVIAITARWLLLNVRGFARRAEQEQDADRADLMVRAAGDRVAPIVALLLWVIAAALTLVLGGRLVGAAGTEVLMPLAATLTGGLLVAAPLILFVVPALCVRHGAGHRDPGMETGGRRIEGATGDA